MPREMPKRRPPKPTTAISDSLGTQYPVNLTLGELKSLYRNDPHRKTLRKILEKKEAGS